MTDENDKGFLDTVSQYWKNFKNKISDYLGINKDDKPLDNDEKGEPDYIRGRIYLKDMDKNMVNPLIRDMMIKEMSETQTNQYIDTQKQSLHKTIEKLNEYKEKCKPYEEFESILHKKWIEKEENYHKTLGDQKPNGELENLSKMKEEYEKTLQQKRNELGITDTYMQYANKLTGLGNGENSYCIAIQTKAMSDALKSCGNEILNKVKEGMGWTCDYATDFFNKKGFAQNYTPSEVPFVKTKDGKWIAKKDENGNPLIKDGDMCIVGKEHCIRFNVDKDGVLSYSAGNKERIEEKNMSWIEKSPITVIKTSDYANSLLKNKYNSMSNEELLEKYKEFKQKDGKADFYFEPKKSNRDEIKNDMKRTRNILAKRGIGLPFSQNANAAKNKRELIAKFNSRVDSRKEQKQNEEQTNKRAKIKGTEKINWFGFRQRD